MGTVLFLLALSLEKIVAIDTFYIVLIVGAIIITINLLGGIEAVIHKMDAFEKYEIFNIGNNKPVALKDFIDAVETSCGKEAIKVMFPMQEGDVYKTYASIDKLNQLTGYSPETNIREGIHKFVYWYKEYYKIS